MSLQHEFHALILIKVIDAASLDPPTASTLGSNYEAMRDSVSNTHQNADSYRVFASLCSRSLYKRALLQDDPVRIPN